jgi:hypothetical protein
MNKPNPGSNEARVQGCTCPVIDNNFGEGVPDGHGGLQFDVTGDCPLHGFARLPQLLSKLSSLLKSLQHGLMR